MRYSDIYNIIDMKMSAKSISSYPNIIVTFAIYWNTAQPYSTSTLVMNWYLFEADVAMYVITTLVSPSKISSWDALMTGVRSLIRILKCIKKSKRANSAALFVEFLKGLAGKKLD